MVSLLWWILGFYWIVVGGQALNAMVSLLWWILGFYWIVVSGQALLQEAPDLYWLALRCSVRCLVLKLQFLSYKHQKGTKFYPTICRKGKMMPQLDQPLPQWIIAQWVIDLCLFLMCFASFACGIVKMVFHKQHGMIVSLTVTVPIVVLSVRSLCYLLLKRPKMPDYVTLPSSDVPDSVSISVSVSADVPQHVPNPKAELFKMVKILFYVTLFQELLHYLSIFGLVTCMIILFLSGDERGDGSA